MRNTSDLIGNSFIHLSYRKVIVLSCLICAAANLFWHWIDLRYFPEAYFNHGIRYGVTLVIALTGVAVAMHRKVSLKQARVLLIICGFILMAQQGFFAVMSNFHFTFIVGLFMCLSGLCAVFIYHRDLLISTVLSVVGMLPVVWIQNNSSGWVLFGAFINVALVMYLANYLRLSATEQLEEASLKLAEAHRDVQNMVDSLDEGYFVFNRDGICRAIASNKAIQFLGQDPQGKSFAEVLALPMENHPLTQKWIHILFEGRVDFSSAASLGPKRLERPGLKQFISLDYKPLVRADGELDSVVVIALDKTEVVESEKKVAALKNESLQIVSISKNRSAFRSFLVEFKEWIPSLSHQDEDFEFQVHTFKGRASHYFLTKLTDALHRIESNYRQTKNSSQSAEVDETCRMQLTVTLEEEIQRLSGLFNDSFLNNEEKIAVSKSALKDLEVILGRAGQAGLYQEVYSRLCSVTLADLFGEFASSTKALATKKGKAVEFVFGKGKELKIDPDAAQVWLPLLVHIFNNSLAHGIEEPEVRRSCGKPEQGTIRISAVACTESQRLCLSIGDDGAGIDSLKIKNKLLRQGINSADWSEAQLISQVFAAGFSSQDDVDTIAGRGLGLSAVAYEIKKQGGSILVESAKGLGTTFIIELPFSQGIDSLSLAS